MHIVQVLPELQEGGVERGVVELNRELVRLGHQSTVVSCGGRLVKTVERDGGRHCQLDVCSKNPLTGPLRIGRLRHLLQELQPDILHARSRVPAWLCHFANRPLHLPFVTTVHGFNSVNAYSRVMTRGDRVICVSRAIRDYVQTHYAVPDEKLVVIPRGVDLEAFDPQNLDRTFMERFADEHGFAGKQVITSVGRITQLKDYETFIRAIAILAGQGADVVGLIVGGVRDDKQDYFNSLQGLVSDLGVEERIVFAGNQQKIAEIYALSDVVVSSSKKPESFGRAAAEALAMGVPVVATGHGGVLDIVQPAETGFLFTPGDNGQLAACLSRAVDHPWEGLRDFVNFRFTLAKMVEGTLEVYRALAADSQQPAR